MITLRVVLESLASTAPSWAEQIIPDVGIDSRTLIPGSMFVALRGESVDGHSFVGDAFSRGASFALIDHPVGDDLRVLDLRTGSKTDLENEHSFVNLV